MNMPMASDTNIPMASDTTMNMPMASDTNTTMENNIDQLQITGTSVGTGMFKFRCRLRSEVKGVKGHVPIEDPLTWNST